MSRNFGQRIVIILSSSLAVAIKKEVMDIGIIRRNA